MTNTNTTITFTSNFSKDMIPVIAFKESGCKFCFVDVKNNTVLHDPYVTEEWRKRKGISPVKFLGWVVGYYTWHQAAGIFNGVKSLLDKDDKAIIRWHECAGKNAEDLIIG